MRQWTTPEDIRARVHREWQKGRLLAVCLAGETRYPWRIPLRAPHAANMPDAFDAVRQWIRLLAEGAKRAGGAGYRLESHEIKHRQLGRNNIPVAAWLDTEQDALALIGKRREALCFQEMLESTAHVFPDLRPWFVQRPLLAMAHTDDWPALLEVLRWVVAHPRSNRYLRQIDVPGVHTKFIEQHKALLSELLERVLPPETIDVHASGVRGFERRYGFRAKPVPIRFRLLDRQLALHGLSDLTAPSDEFAQLDLAVRRVFITENEINFLAFPMLPESLVIFGAGYGFEPLAQAHWLHEKTIYYWGDIDTHGFAILDQLRAYFPAARSLLMDRETLRAHRALWGAEDQPLKRDLSRLLPDEAALYDALRTNHYAPALRMEQERIGYAWVEAAVKKAVDIEHSLPVPNVVGILDR